MDPATVAALDQVIRDRRTVKVRADAPWPAEPLGEVVETLCASAGWAPFHRPAAERHRQGAGGSIMPFRLHIVDAPDCRRLREHLLDTDGGSAVKMLATARTLIQATWLPDPDPAPDPDAGADGRLFAPTLRNMEHIAAAAAAIQNLLLAATARGIVSYWSSGGILRTPEVFDRLGIPRDQVLLGAIFLFPDDAIRGAVRGAAGEGARGVEVRTSKLRDHRGPLSGWVRRVTVECRSTRR